MKLSSLKFAYVLTSLSLISVSFSLPQPAQAAISCEPGTINRYSNGSLASCTLRQDTTLQVASASGTSNFPCKAQGNIWFDEKGQFQQCQLSEDIQIRTGNSIEQCPMDFWVKLSILSNGNISITCHKYLY
ncbi:MULTISPECIES: hypothetical protein [unclassified Anabaena]|uniref:hypothetical protein n=1 Tax=unclassified Anabaena TaxID=2619674 RepID=UPI0008365372|nr:MULTISPECIES: hypothetical protein [unclassified Anabaena]